MDVVIHWGVDTSTLTYWRELRHCARVSIRYSFAANETLVKEDDPMKSPISAESCYRELLLKQFDICDKVFSAKTVCDKGFSLFVCCLTTHQP